METYENIACDLTSMSEYRVSPSYGEIFALSPEYAEASSIPHYLLNNRAEGRDSQEGAPWQVGNCPSWF